MTLTIEQTPAVEQRLSAAANGQALRDYINQILEQAAQVSGTEPRSEIDFTERLRAIQEFNEAAAEMAPTLPILSDYATTREGIYEGYTEHLLGYSEGGVSERHR